MLRNLTFLVMAMFFYSCGELSNKGDSSKDSDKGKNQEEKQGDSNESDHEEWSYKFELNGCSTGNQTFSGKSQMCEGLMDTERNRGCALQMRRDFYFKNNCDDVL